MHAAIVLHLVAYCPVSLWYRFCSVYGATVFTSFLLALSFCSCRLVGRRFCRVLQFCGTCCSLWFSAPVCTLVLFAGGCRWWVGSRVLSFHERAFWRDFYFVYWLVEIDSRGAKRCHARVCCPILRIFCACCTRIVLRIQWYVATGAYHMSSESAHPRLMESDDVVCFSQFSCSGLVFFACLNWTVRVHHSTPYLSLSHVPYQQRTR